MAVSWLPAWEYLSCTSGVRLGTVGDILVLAGLAHGAQGTTLPPLVESGK